jgi:hypothetical protein
MSTTLLGRWCGRLALLVAALGLVLMHHVVGAHQHSTADTGAIAADHVPAAAGGTSVPSVEHGAAVHGHSPTAHEAISPDAATVAPGLNSASSAALLHDHTDKGGHEHAGSLLHMCLAALMGAAAFLVLVLVAVRCRFEGQAPGGGRVSTAIVPRAPPTPTRLAELQVLRL